MREILASIFLFVFVTVICTFVGWIGFEVYSYYAPRYEAVNRDVMLQSRSYQEGAIRELYSIQRQYISAKTDEEKATLAAAARHEFSIFPKERLPADLVIFMNSIGG